jgi:hypothetical protein
MCISCDEYIPNIKPVVSYMYDIPTKNEACLEIWVVQYIKKQMWINFSLNFIMYDTNFVDDSFLCLDILDIYSLRFTIKF